MMSILLDYILEDQTVGFGLGPCGHNRLANFTVAVNSASEGLVATGSVKKFIVITVSILKILL
jgi:hypothetical protein